MILKKLLHPLLATAVAIAFLVCAVWLNSPPTEHTKDGHPVTKPSLITENRTTEIPVTDDDSSTPNQESVEDTKEELGFLITNTLWESSERSGNRIIRKRILETDLEQKWIRIEETYEVDLQTTQQRLVSRFTSIADQQIIKLAANTNPAELALFTAPLGLTVHTISRNASLYLVEQNDKTTLQDLPSKLAELDRYPDIVSYSEPDYLLHASVTIPNDPRFTEQVSLNGGPRFDDIDAPEAWDISNHSPNVIVAVIDTGILESHQDLSANLWHNPGEIPNGKDDDGNGIIDDIHGFNAIANNGSPDDDAGHGTHVAGIIGAQGNNGVGIAGITWDVQIMALKFLEKSGNGATSGAIKCIYYAIDQNVDIINNSWGGSGRSSSLLEALEDASANGILIATAAGNETNNLREIPLLPGCLRSPQSSCRNLERSIRQHALIFQL